jgi:hypothetical protein
MRRSVLVLIIALLGASSAQAQHSPAHGGTPAADTAHSTPMMMVDGPLGIPETREGSGTSWQPDASPMNAIHGQAGAWELMLHGNLVVQYIHQGSERGRDQFGSINWVMGMARRPLAGGVLGLRTMLSAEPYTIRGCSYPLLLATGEVCEGGQIHDAQHPHDLFMEVAAIYDRPITDRVALQLYAAPAGEPALGPAAYPHRVSAVGNPLAPISHHWFDATHIAFGVLTGGVYGQRWKLEGSLFNGREPDEHRTDIDLAPLDSYSGRLWVLPSERWALQLSAGRLKEAEAGHELGEPRIDVSRYTTSATYHRPLGDDGTWASTAMLGRNEEQGRSTNAVLLESSLELEQRDIIFARAEWAEKTGHDLALEHAVEETIFTVGTLSAGYVRQLGPLHGWLPGLGVQASVNFVPTSLEPYYGERHPMGITLFASLRPARMRMGHESSMPPMPADGDHSTHR